MYSVRQTTHHSPFERTKMFDWKRDRKALARQSAMIKSSKGASKVAIFLPSNRQLCIKAALEAGTINKRTFVIAIEKEPKVVPILRRGMKKLGFVEGKNLHIHRGDAHTLDVENVLIGRKIDFAFLDFCGEAKADTVAWVAYLMQFVSVGSDIHVTHSFKGRANKLLKHVVNYTGRHDGMEEMLLNNDNCSLVKDSKEEASTWLFWAALSSRHNVDITAHQRYKDNASRTPMCMTSFHVIRDKWGDPADWKLLYKMLKNDHNINPFTMMQRGRTAGTKDTGEKNPIMVRAGRKAWETRLKNLAA